ncbi:o-succinylbenzoate synthase [Gangjinia marincola]|uniref:O-succinylbenzoate synthase n=1 Tax=Gangjinia marincola TaxID=578463 RepID=A0ABN1MG78_9FLAO
MKATYHRHVLEFKRPSGTSRGVLKIKETWFLIIQDGERKGIGECGLLRGLSVDDRPDYEEKLQWVCENIALGPEMLWNSLTEFPSIQFGVEMAFQSLRSQQPFELFPSAFTRGEEAIPINGLVWMGEKQFMKEQIVSKIKEGFRCIKLKIGAIDFQEELELLGYIRSELSSADIELRVDANGAFSAKAALKKLEQLAQFDLHSIEQPIKPNQWHEMAQLCEKTPLPIALDEELIGVTNNETKRLVLDTIQPQFVIFKPSLIGGFKGTQEWIDACETRNVDWWVTSALESNVGLNAISQWTFTKNVSMPQGLGTGGLYTNNITSPLEIKKGFIHYNPEKDWIFNF